MDFLESEGFSLWKRSHCVLWTMFQTVLEKWVSIWMLQARG